jgi:hypothetical protein
MHEEESSFHSKAAAHLPFEYVKDDPITPSASNSSSNNNNDNNNDDDSTRTGGRKPHSSNSRSSMLLTLTLAVLMPAVATVHSPAALIIASPYKRNIFCQAKPHGDNDGGIWNWFFCVRTVVVGSEDDGTDDDVTEEQKQRRALNIVNDETIPSVDGDLKESLPESESLDYKASLQPQHGQQQLQLNHQESQAEFSSSLNYVAAPEDLQKEENKELSSRQNDVTSPPPPLERLGQAKVYLLPAAAAAAAAVVTNYHVAFSGHEKDGYDYYFYLYDGNEHDHDNLDGAFLETEQGEHFNMEQVNEGEDHDMVDGEWYYFDVDEHGYYLDDYDDYEDEEEDGEYGYYEHDEDYDEDEDEDEEWEEWEDEEDADDESNENGD